MELHPKRRQPGQDTFLVQHCDHKIVLTAMVIQALGTRHYNSAKQGGGHTEAMYFDDDEHSDDHKNPKKPSGTAKSDSPSVTKKESGAKKKWKKPKDMPKRPLSAYNLFFAEERRQLLSGGDTSLGSQVIVPESDATTGISKKKLGFAGLARSVATKWKTLTPEMKAPYEEEAGKEQARYKSQIKEYNEHRLREGKRGSEWSTPISSSTEERQVSHASLDELASTSLWPAMPQTIASLGDIYNADPDGGERASVARDFDQLEATALAKPKGELKMSAQMAAKGNSPDSFPSPLRLFQDQMSSKNQRPLNDPLDVFQQERITPRDPQNQGSARGLSDQVGITKLASQLDEDQVDFLQSLKKLGEE